MNRRPLTMTAAVFAAMVAASAVVEADLVSGVTGYDNSLRPIHWWIGNLENRAQAETANLVASWSYWPLDGVYDVSKEERRMRLLVGGVNNYLIYGTRDPVVPEPSILVLLCMGAAGLVTRVSRRAGVG